MKQLVDGFALFQAGQSTVLPVDRRSIGQSTAQTLVTDLQRLMTQLQPLIENLPEGVIQILDIVMVAGCLPNFQSAQSNIGEVDGDDSLVETPVILGLIGLVIAGIGNIVPAVTGAVGCQEATASHTGIAIAVTFGFAL